MLLLVFLNNGICQMRLPPLKTLPAFVAVAKHLSFSKAADELFVTHSAISQNIKNLEEFLGHKLFERDNANVSLTKRGKVYLNDIDSALATIARATKLQRQADNIFTLNIVNTLAMHWLIPRLPEFQALHQDIDLRIATLGRPVDFSRDNIGLSIEYGFADNWPGLHVEKLFDDSLILVANPNLVAGDLKLAKNYKCIYVKQQMRKGDWSIWCKELGVTETVKNERVYFASSSQALRATLSGAGVMVTHKPFVKAELAAGRLLQLKKEVKIDSKFFILTAEEVLADSRAEKVISWLRCASNAE